MEMGLFLLGSSWKNNQIIVNSTPIIIKTITKQGDGRASHLNLQVDVTSALDGAGKTSDIFNSNTSYRASYHESGCSEF